MGLAETYLGIAQGAKAAADETGRVADETGRFAKEERALVDALRRLTSITAPASFAPGAPIPPSPLPDFPQTPGSPSGPRLVDPTGRPLLPSLNRSDRSVGPGGGGGGGKFKLPEIGPYTRIPSMTGGSPVQLWILEEYGDPGTFQIPGVGFGVLAREVEGWYYSSGPFAHFYADPRKTKELSPRVSATSSGGARGGGGGRRISDRRQQAIQRGAARDFTGGGTGIQAGTARDFGRGSAGASAGASVSLLADGPQTVRTLQDLGNKLDRTNSLLGSIAHGDGGAGLRLFGDI